MIERVNKPRGFALLTPEKRSIVASKGGKAVRPEKRVFSRNPDFARECGKLGGAAMKAKWGITSKEEK